MDDLISRQVAIDLFPNDDLECDTKGGYIAPHLARQMISELPSAQPERLTDDDFETIRIHLNAYKEKLCNQHRWEEANEYQRIIDRFMAFASAQPETHEERTETHTCDLISRQAAIDAIQKWKRYETTEGLVDRINNLPSAHPEPCVDTIDALNESIKHFDDMAEECRRNANIERNDYMDMRDDAAEYRQLSIWLNELKWLRERFQSQPEHTNSWCINSWCIDCKEYDTENKCCPRYNRVIKQTLDDAYMHGETEAEARFHDEIVRCKECRFYKSDGCFFSTAETIEDGFCSWAERRTDEGD